VLHLAYHSNGLFGLPLHRAIEEVSKAGYEGIDLAISAEHLDPYRVSNNDLDAIRRQLGRAGVKPVCVDTGWPWLLSETPFEPSLISSDRQGRQERIRLISRGLEIANYLGVPVVTFTSGVRHHPKVSSEQAARWLEEGVRACLEHVGEVTLLIEPEAPVWTDASTVIYSFVEMVDNAIDLIKTIDSPRFRMVTDICHAHCSEEDMLEAIARALPYTKYMHVADIIGKVHHHEIPGQGEVDLPAAIGLLETMGYDGALTVELMSHSDAWETALQPSYEYLKALMH
jgi:hydroxypyruvate isomerase